MKRSLGVAMVLWVALAPVAAPAQDRAVDVCTPAICASISPICWLAYEKVVVYKGDVIKSEAECKRVAKEDAAGFGKALGVQGVTAKIGVCACAAAYWSIDGPAQGLGAWLGALIWHKISRFRFRTCFTTDC